MRFSNPCCHGEQGSLPPQRALRQPVKSGDREFPLCAVDLGLGELELAAGCLGATARLPMNPCLKGGYGNVAQHTAGTQQALRKLRCYSDPVI